MVAVAGAAAAAASAEPAMDFDVFDFLGVFSQARLLTQQAVYHTVVVEVRESSQ